jgi:hypothetical protein
MYGEDTDDVSVLQIDKVILLSKDEIDTITYHSLFQDESFVGFATHYDHSSVGEVVKVLLVSM